MSYNPDALETPVNADRADFSTFDSWQQPSTTHPTIVYIGLTLDPGSTSASQIDILEDPDNDSTAERTTSLKAPGGLGENQQFTTVLYVPPSGQYQLGNTSDPDSGNSFTAWEWPFTTAAPSYTPDAVELAADGDEGGSIDNFGSWVQVSADRPALVDGKFEPDGTATSPARMSLLTDPDGDSTAEDSRQWVSDDDRADFDFGPDFWVQTFLPPGGQYQVTNDNDPNDNNSFTPKEWTFGAPPSHSPDTMTSASNGDRQDFSTFDSDRDPDSNRPAIVAAKLHGDPSGTNNARIEIIRKDSDGINNPDCNFQWPSGGVTRDFLATFYVAPSATYEIRNQADPNSNNSFTAWEWVV